MRALSYLLLGEGDFTYSLDMCRYIASCSRQKTVDNRDAALYSITCTGVDTLEELRGKYKDADFVLRNIRSCADYDEKCINDDQSSSKPWLATTILHGVNAVQTESTAINEENLQKQPLLQHFDRVMFHHPHLGREDAQLHSRFLHHFFHAAVNRWLKPGSDTPRADTLKVSNTNVNNRSNAESKMCDSRIQGGLLYITLVNGQCSRWKCIEAAKKHGLILIRRTPFFPPPAVASQSTYYQLRRHQSGKSFAKRRRMQQDDVEQSRQSNRLYEDNNVNDSETLVFGLASDYTYDTSSSEQYYNVGLLPWENDSELAISMQSPTENKYSCQYCTKTFREERSLKNHMLNTHPECKEVASWATKKKSKKKYKASANDKGEVVDNYKISEASTQQSNSDKMLVGISSHGSLLTCSICKEQKQSDPMQNSNPRTFPYMQALLDHQKAKHFGSHTDIKPDWCNPENNSEQTPSKDAIAVHNQTGNAQKVITGTCSVCGIQYSSEAAKLKHELEFIPLPSMQSHQSLQKETVHDGTVSFECKYCSKPFRGLRAQRQHENFCATRETLSQNISPKC